MAELTPKEKLQPSLLDRLIDEHPEKKEESSRERVLSHQQLRAGVIRDLAWLFNTTNFASAEDLENFPQTARSVVNFGIPELAGKTLGHMKNADVESIIRQAIWDFEPRITRNTVRIKMLTADDQMNRNAIAFEIRGELWAQPAPLHLRLKTEIDLETGDAAISDSPRGGN